MRNMVQKILFGLIITLGLIFLVQSANAQVKETGPGGLTLYSIGEKDAPVVFYDYSSLSCPHCASFHNEILPRIKAEYIDTGVARIVFGPMPLNQAALKGELLARCVPEEQYIRALNLLFENQRRWAFENDIDRALINQGKLLGLEEDKVKSCITDESLELEIAGAARVLAQQNNITSTPTFVFDGGERVLRGTGTYDRYAELIEFLKKEHDKAEEYKDIPEDTTGYNDKSSSEANNG